MSSFPGLKLSDSHWQFMMQNLSPIVVVLQMLNMCVSNEMLRTIDWHDTLFNNQCHLDHEVRKVECAKENGCCAVRGNKRGKFARAGSASNKIGHVHATGDSKGRVNDHLNESKKHQAKSYFYNCYPDSNYDRANKSLKRGNFQDLSFTSPLRFKEENKSKVQDLFFWSEDVINYLTIRKPAGCRTLLDKKN